MAIFTITNGAASNLAVVKVTPLDQDCFTLYEYIVTTNSGNNIDILLTGNHFEAKYVSNGTTVSFNDSANVSYNTSLRIRFLLLNSGTAGVFSSATIKITNNTTGVYYENFVERQDDSANCYSPIAVPTKTSDLLNDGATGVSTYAETTSLANYLPLAGGIMTGNIILSNAANIGMAGGELQAASRLDIRNVPNDTTIIHNFLTDDIYRIGTVTGTNLQYIDSTDTWSLSGDNIVTSSDLLTLDGNNVSFDAYLTITSANVQLAIQELKDELNAAVIGSFSLDTVITDASVNPVQNNAIYDEFQLVPYLAGANTFTAATNTFNNTILIDNGTNGMELFSVAGLNYIDVNAGELRIRTNALAEAWKFTQGGALNGSPASSLYSGIITTDYEAYNSGWNGSLEVPTKDAVYDKIESLTGGVVNISGTPVDNQVTVWTNANTIEGTAGFTYNGSNLLLTGDIGITGTRITKGWFTDLEVTNAIAGSITGNAATVTSIGNLTGDVTSVNRVTTIAVGAVDIPMLSASGTPSASNFLRGDNTWSVPAGGGDVSKVGIPVNNQLAVWTGDGTVEGDANLTWDSAILRVSGNAVWHAGNDGIGSDVDAHYLGGVAYGNYLRSDVADEKTAGNLTFNDGIYLRFGTLGGESNIQSDGIGTFWNLQNGNLTIQDTGVTRFTFGRTTGNLTATGFTGDGAALTNVNATTLDSIDSTQFLRSDVADNKTSGSLTFNDDVHLRLGTTSSIRMLSNTGNTLFDLLTGDLIIRDNLTSMFTFGRTTGNFTATGLTTTASARVTGLGGSGTTFVQTDNDGDLINSGVTYETGSFTVGVSGEFTGTYTIGSQAANYTKIGKLVFFTIFLSGLSGSAPTGNLQITGLPFACAVACIVPVELANNNVNFYSIVGQVTVSRIVFNIQQALDDENTGSLANVDFTTSGYIRVSGCYMTA